MLASGTRAHKANAKLQHISLITKYFCKKMILLSKKIVIRGQRKIRGG